MKLHGSLCPPEWFSFHNETLERLFRKNFQEEIQRLNMDSTPISPSMMRSNRSLPEMDYLHERKRSESSNAAGKPSFYLPPLQLGRSVVTPPPSSPKPDQSLMAVTAVHSSKQTPLQRHVAHLARTGMHGVSSGPGDTQGSDTMSAGSPHGSFVNVGTTLPAIGNSGASIVTSNFGTSIGSIKGRFSRLGSLNFGRRE